MAERRTPAKKTGQRRKEGGASERARSRGNSTILIGAQLLSVISRLDGPASLTRIAEAASLSPSRAYRYLRGLVESRYVEQDPLSGRYDLGAEALHVGLAALGRVEPCRRAMAVLPELTERTRLVASLTVWGSHGPTVLMSEHGSLISQLRVREGIVLPLLGTAAGKVFLTYMPAKHTEPVLGREIAEWNVDRAPADAMTPARIAELQEEVRSNGVAASSGRRNRTHANLAAPVFDHLGRLCLAISLIGVRGTFDDSPTGSTALELKRMTQALSDRLGATRAPDADALPVPARLLDRV
jgi:DNA-binding IclR family transcriptional regulator